MVIRALCRKAAVCYRRVRNLTSGAPPFQGRAELLLEQPRNLTGLRKSAGRFLTENKLPVKRDLEAPAAPALELDRAHDRRPPAQQLAGQAHGLVKVVSRDAEFDPRLVERSHHFTLIRLFFGLCSTSATIVGGFSDSSRYMRYSDDPLGVVSCHGGCLVPDPFAVTSRATSSHHRCSKA
jgi:hypothetical protein